MASSPPGVDNKSVRGIPVDEPVAPFAGILRNAGCRDSLTKRHSPPACAYSYERQRRLFGSRPDSVGAVA